MTKPYAIGISLTQEALNDIFDPGRPARSEPLPYKPDPIETLVEAARKIPELEPLANAAMKYWDDWND